MANGAYERGFANGIVVVNPTGKSIPSFSLGGRHLLRLGAERRPIGSAGTDDRADPPQDRMS
jgi:hypothetical protein